LIRRAVLGAGPSRVLSLAADCVAKIVGRPLGLSVALAPTGVHRFGDARDRLRQQRLLLPRAGVGPGGFASRLSRTGAGADLALRLVSARAQPTDQFPQFCRRPLVQGLALPDHVRFFAV